MALLPNLWDVYGPVLHHSDQEHWPGQVRVETITVQGLRFLDAIRSQGQSVWALAEMRSPLETEITKSTIFS
jgi:hypothetical protein